MGKRSRLEKEVIQEPFQEVFITLTIALDMQPSLQIQTQTKQVQIQIQTLTIASRHATFSLHRFLSFRWCPQPTEPKTWVGKKLPLIFTEHKSLALIWHKSRNTIYLAAADKYQSSTRPLQEGAREFRSRKRAPVFLEKRNKQSIDTKSAPGECIRLSSSFSIQSDNLIFYLVRQSDWQQKSSYPCQIRSRKQWM